MSKRALGKTALALLLLATCGVAACSNDGKSDAHASAGSSGAGAAGSGSGGKAGAGASGGGDATGGTSKGGATGGSDGTSGGGQGGKAGSAAQGAGGDEAEGGDGMGGADMHGDGGWGMGEGGAGGVQVECGNGIKEAGEECEPANTSTCTERCQIVSTKACVDCEAAGACINHSNICFDNFAGEDERSICYEVLKCVRGSDCADGAHTPQDCFCGTLSTGQCQAAPSSGAGSPNGPCAPIIREAMAIAGQEATSAQVLEHLIDESLPGGAALARVNCDRQDPACITACGY